MQWAVVLRGDNMHKNKRFTGFIDHADNNYQKRLISPKISFFVQFVLVTSATLELCERTGHLICLLR